MRPNDPIPRRVAPPGRSQAAEYPTRHSEFLLGEVFVDEGNLTPVHRADTGATKKIIGFHRADILNQTSPKKLNDIAVAILGMDAGSAQFQFSARQGQKRPPRSNSDWE